MTVKSAAMDYTPGSPGVAVDLAVILLICLFLDSLLRRLRLPGLLGMLAVTTLALPTPITPEIALAVALLAVAIIASVEHRTLAPPGTGHVSAS